MHVIFCKHNRAQKRKHRFNFERNKKAQKYYNFFFASLKKLKNMNSIVWKINKGKTRGFNF